MTDGYHKHDRIDRSPVKKGTVAGATAGAAAIGATATAAAQDDDDDDDDDALVFAYDYFPGDSFDVISLLQQSTTVDMLRVDGETVDVISQPDEWTGYVIRYDSSDSEDTGLTTFLFTRGDDLDVDDSADIGEDADVFSTDLNLLSADLD